MCRSRNDLRNIGALDPAKLSVVFRMDEGTLMEATVIPFIKQDELKALTSEILRFCPICLRNGFHSSLYQLLFLTRCPMHGDQIVTCCSQCSCSVIPYKLSSLFAEDLPVCPHVMDGLIKH